MIQFSTRVLTVFLMLVGNFSVYADHDRLPASANVSEYEPVLDTLQQCITCHGEHVSTLQPTFPILSGQHFYYLYVQLKDFNPVYEKTKLWGRLPHSSQNLR